MGTTLTAFAVFALTMIGIGIWGMRRTRSIHDFVLAGRTIGPWIAALSFGTAYFSAVVFIGFAGKLGWLFGMEVLWIALGNALFGACLAWLVLGRRTRRMSHRLNAMTMPEFFEARYGSPAMKLIAALIVFVFLLPYSAGVFKGVSHLFQVNFGISFTKSLSIMTGLTGIYLVLGGYKAASRSDFIQGIIMLVGSLAIVVCLLGKADYQLGSVIDRTVAAHATHVPQPPPPSILWSLVFMTSFGTWGLPQMIQKFYAIGDERMIGRGAAVTTVFALVVVTCAYFIGALTHLHFAAVPEGNFDLLVPEMLMQTLPGWLLGLVLLLILAASMSTLAALILVSASAIVVDVIKVHAPGRMPASRQVAIMRWLTALLCVISFALALVANYRQTFIVDLITLSWGAVAGAFMAPYLYGLFWRRTTKAGAMAGIGTGLGTMILLYFLWGEARLPVAASLAMLLPFVVVPVVSRFTAPLSDTLVAHAFGGGTEAIARATTEPAVAVAPAPDAPG